MTFDGTILDTGLYWELRTLKVKEAIASTQVKPSNGTKENGNALSKNYTVSVL